MSVVFVGIITGGTEKAGDDAQEIEWIELEKIDASRLAFDHALIMRDYTKWKILGGSFWSSKRRN